MTIESKICVPEDVPPRSKLLNPIWWLMDGGTNATWTAPEINNGEPYLPNVKIQLVRNVLWWMRNPFANFVGFIIGFEGVTYTVRGTAPVLFNTWRDVGDGSTHGWRWAVINGWAPFVSYWGGWLEFYTGWRPSSGGFGTKIIFRGGILKPFKRG